MLPSFSMDRPGLGTVQPNQIFLYPKQASWAASRRSRGSTGEPGFMPCETLWQYQKAPILGGRTIRLVARIIHPSPPKCPKKKHSMLPGMGSRIIKPWSERCPPHVPLLRIPRGSPIIVWNPTWQIRSQGPGKERHPRGPSHQRPGRNS